MSIDMISPAGGWNYGLSLIADNGYRAEARVFYSDLSHQYDEQDHILLWTRFVDVPNRSITLKLTPDESEALGIALIIGANKIREREENGADS